MFGLTNVDPIHIPCVLFCVHSYTANKLFCGRSFQASLNFKQSYICHSLQESAGTFTASCTFLYSRVFKLNGQISYIDEFVG